MKMHPHSNKISWAACAVLSLATVIFQQPGLAQFGQSQCYNDPYDIDHDCVRDITPPSYTPPGQSYPTSPTYRNNNQTGWTVCNMSNEQNVYVAVSYYDGQAWVRRGWLRIGRWECPTLIPDILTQYVYLYAGGDNGTIWSGDKQICVDPVEEFFLPPMSECSAPYQYLPFMTIDTENMPGWLTVLR